MNRDIFWNKVFDILKNICGASENLRLDFVLDQCQDNHPTEYRFCGNLGFGGKFWRNMGRMYVNCYSENETPERLEMIKKANNELSILNEKYFVDK